MKVPLITTFFSLLYLVIWSRDATTVEGFFLLQSAWMLLMFIFVLCWIELSIYIHAQTYIDVDYWNMQLETVPIVSEEYDEEDEYVFPEGASYLNMPPSLERFYILY
jgi:hypothetical protein